MNKAMLIAAYGTAGLQARASLRAFEDIARNRFPEWSLRWAFTSCLGRQRLALQRQKSDSVHKALLRLSFEGFTHIAIQPLQTIAGCEHENVREAMLEAMKKRKKLRCSLGKPLMHKGQKLESVAQALLSHLPQERLPGENVIFMGHGARHKAGEIYADLARAVSALDRHVHIGTMHSICALDLIIPQLNAGLVWLLPLLSTVGQHALRDMAGKDPASWRSRIERAGHECRPLLRGMTDSPALCEIWLQNLAAAMGQLESEL